MCQIFSTEKNNNVRRCRLIISELDSFITFVIADLKLFSFQLGRQYLLYDEHILRIIRLAFTLMVLMFRDCGFKYMVLEVSDSTDFSRNFIFYENLHIVQCFFVMHVFGLHGFGYTRLRKIVIKKIVQFMTRKQLYTISVCAQAKVIFLWKIFFSFHAALSGM